MTETENQIETTPEMETALAALLGDEQTEDAVQPATDENPEEVGEIPEFGDSSDEPDSEADSEPSSDFWPEGFLESLPPEAKEIAIRKEKGFQKEHAKANDLRRLDSLVTDPVNGVKATVEIARNLLAQHGTTLEEVLGLNIESYEEDDSYELPEVKELKRKVAELEAKTGSDPRVDKLLAEIETQKNEAALASYVDAHYKSIAAKMEAEYGWKPTSDQVVKAMRAERSKDPIKATIRHFAEDIVKAGVATKRRGVPSMIDSSKGSATALPSGEEFTMAHALAVADKMHSK